jgi:hypothetical protein
MTAETFLGFRRACEFLYVTLPAFIDAGTVSARLHVGMSGCPVTVHTLQPFVDMIAVGVFDGTLFDCVVNFEDLRMTV